ncbi:MULTISPECIES: serine hydrolase [Aquimarina]|uniref:serine hydrolase n=1 Tax=Aquimarina TaxID=290174 RepID=UPI00094220C9|nr:MULTISPECIES: serine hydrolase [Aquimarina]
MSSSKIIVIIVLSLCLYGLQAQQTKFSILSDADETWVDGRFTQLLHQNKIKTASVAIIKKGKIVYLKGYGHDLINGRSVLATACTNYRIGSISKFITATVAFKLVEEGKLNIEDKITKYVPEYPEKQIKIKHLLAHLSGIPDNSSTNSTYFNNNDFFNPIAAINLFKNQALIDPGSYPSDNEFDGFYSNYGYNLLGAVLERAGEAPFSQLVYEKISAPLHLPFLGPELKWDEPFYTHKYRSVNGFLQGLTTPNGQYLHHLPSGAFKASVIDLALLAQAIMKDHVFDQNGTFDLMSDFHSSLTNKGNRRYGYGVERLRVNFPNYDFSSVYGHRGSISGGGGTMYFVPKYTKGSNTFEHKDGIVILSNTTGTYESVALDILDQIDNMSITASVFDPGFVPEDPFVPASSSFFNGVANNFFGERFTKSSIIPVFVDEMNYVGKKVNLGIGFEVTENTEFEVRLTNQNKECPDHDGLTIGRLSSKNVVSRQTSKQNISILQNPVNDVLTITTLELPPTAIRVYNIYGQKVIDNNAEKTKHLIKVEHLPPGTYIIQLINGTSILEHKRFIKK